jgi:hypothetical protein
VADLTSSECTTSKKCPPTLQLIDWVVSPMSCG